MAVMWRPSLSSRWRKSYCILARTPSPMRHVYSSHSCRIYCKNLGHISVWRSSFSSIRIPIIQIRLSWDHLICLMWIPILVRQHLYIGNPLTRTMSSKRLVCSSHSSRIFHKNMSEPSWSVWLDHWHLLSAGTAMSPSTHWGPDKMAAISQTTLSITFSWMKMLELRLNFHWSLFLRVQLTIFQHWFR